MWHGFVCFCGSIWVSFKYHVNYIQGAGRGNWQYWEDLHALVQIVCSLFNGYPCYCNQDSNWNSLLELGQSVLWSFVHSKLLCDVHLYELAFYRSNDPARDQWRVPIDVLEWHCDNIVDSDAIDSSFARHSYPSRIKNSFPITDWHCHAEAEGWPNIHLWRFPWCLYPTASAKSTNNRRYARIVESSLWSDEEPSDCLKHGYKKVWVQVRSWNHEWKSYWVEKGKPSC